MPNIANDTADHDEPTEHKEPASNGAEPMLARPRDAARILTVSPSQIGKWERDGHLVPVSIPGIRAKRYTMANVRKVGRAIINGDLKPKPKPGE